MPSSDSYSETRYVIRFPDGTYSSGPRQERVPFKKAKQWKTLGHLKQHVTGYYRDPYPPGTEFVGIRVTVEVPGGAFGDLAELLANHKLKKQQQREAARLAQAKRQLRDLEEQIAELTNE